MSKIYCEYLRAFNLLYFLGKMSVTERTLFLIWHEEAIPTKAVTGNTNNGNTARRFFQQPDLAARITGVNENLIYRFSVVLRALACGYDINTEAFRLYAMETAEIFVSLYPWFYMPSSVHRILIHGADIINHFSLPIGMMSEEALEARNKDYRNIRENNTRKN